MPNGFIYKSYVYLFLQDGVYNFKYIHLGLKQLSVELERISYHDFFDCDITIERPKGYDEVDPSEDKENVPIWLDPDQDHQKEEEEYEEEEEEEDDDDNEHGGDHHNGYNHNGHDHQSNFDSNYNKGDKDSFNNNGGYMGDKNCVKPECVKTKPPCKTNSCSDDYESAGGSYDQHNAGSGGKNIKSGSKLHWGYILLITIVLILLLIGCFVMANKDKKDSTTNKKNIAKKKPVLSSSNNSSSKKPNKKVAAVAKGKKKKKSNVSDSNNSTTPSIRSGFKKSTNK